MEFYDQLSHYYDLLFQPSQKQLTWAFEFASSGGPLLDAGCATGELCCTLAAGGVKAFGFDSDSEMIRQAAAKSAGMVNAPDFRPARLQNCRESYQAGYFSTLLCLGNTLVHLTDREELQQVMRSFYALLRSGGKLALQLLNYDRILEHRPPELPALEAEAEGTGIRFLRAYRYEGGKVIFEGRLRITDSDGTRESQAETILLPIRRKELTDAAAAAGFSAVRVWKDYGDTPADTDSFFYLLTAEK